MPVKPKVPKNTIVEDDVDSAAADATDQAEVELVDIEYRGHTFQIPRRMDDWDIEACLAMGQHNYSQAAKLLLGAGQWTLLKTLGSTRKDINAFLVAFGVIVKRECIG